MSAALSRTAGLPGMLKLAAALAGAAVIAAACAPASNPPSFSPKISGQLVPQVVDSVNDAGRGDSVALDPQGNPVATYLLTTAILKPGELIPAIVPGQPEPPSVILATRSKGIWTRTAVTGMSVTGPAVGKA